MNKVRAFVVQSQRPLQAVRLLQKEREEREIDSKFTHQKEEIIAKAKDLDEAKKKFMIQQQHMTESIQSDIQTMIKSQLKRKKEDERLAQFNKQLTQQNLTIQELHSSIEKKTNQVEERKKQLDSHKVYTDFLKDVVSDKALGESSDIEWLRGRFINLKNENKKLKMRKAEINQESEDIREAEK